MQEANERLALCVAMRQAVKRELQCLLSDYENPEFMLRQIEFAELQITRAVEELERLRARAETLREQIEQRQAQLVEYSNEIKKLHGRGAIAIDKQNEKREERQREKIKRAAAAKDKRRQALLERFKQLQAEAAQLETTKGVE